MKKILKWIGIVLGVIAGIILLAIAAVFLLSNARINKTYDVPAQPITVPGDAETLAYGEHVATIRACNGCHGPDLGGETMIEHPMLGNYYAANLTTGSGGQLGNYDDAMLARVIRHGIGHDEKPLLIMPAHEFYVMSDEDTAAVIAYLRAQPAVDRVLPENKVGPLGRVLLLNGQLPLLPAELIDHQAARPPAPEPGVTVEYGAYLATTCQGCHKPDYSGGPLPGASPGDPVALNLTPGGELAGWTEDDFVIAIRTGITPSGRELDPAMPAEQFASMTDLELKAIFMYLQSLPPKEQGTQ